MNTGTTSRYVGWLLRVNRKFGPDEALRSGRTFARAFSSKGGRPLAPSQITRWETGDPPPSREAIRRYEQLLGLARGSLVSVAETMMRYADNGASLRMSQEGDRTDLTANGRWKARSTRSSARSANCTSSTRSPSGW
jgi:hypothetical protein